MFFIDQNGSEQQLTSLKDKKSYPISEIISLGDYFWEGTWSQKSLETLVSSFSVTSPGPLEVVFNSHLARIRKALESTSNTVVIDNPMPRVTGNEIVLNWQTDESLPDKKELLGFTQVDRVGLFIGDFLTRDAAVQLLYFMLLAEQKEPVVQWIENMLHWFENVQNVPEVFSDRDFEPLDSTVPLVPDEIHFKELLKDFRARIDH